MKKNIDTIEKTLTELQHFTELECFFKAHYEHNNKNETTNCCQLKPAYKAQFKEHMNRINNGIVDVLTPQAIGMEHSIKLMKHCRYMPPKEHIHEYFELFYVFSGVCIHTCNSVDYHLKAGDFCFWEFDAPHKITSFSDELIAINILIRPEEFESLFFGLLSTRSILSKYFQNILYRNENVSQSMIIFRTDEDREIKSEICEMYQEQKQQQEFYHQMMINHLNKLFILLLRDHITQVVTSVDCNKEENALKIMKYIQEHYNTQTMKEICQHFNYSTAYFSRLIKKNFGMTFSEIVNQKRLERAVWFLENTSLSITEIAQRINCSDHSHFCRIFTKAYHVSPKQYRSNFRKLK